MAHTSSPVSQERKEEKDVKEKILQKNKVTIQKVQFINVIFVNVSDPCYILTDFKREMVLFF